MNNEIIKEFVAKSKERRELEAQLDTVLTRLQELDPLVLEEFTEAGVQSMKIDGRTVYVERKLWAKIADGATKDDVVAGLKAAGYGMYVSETYNSNSVSALLREWEANEQSLPEQLQGKLETSEVYKAKVRLA